MTNAIFMARPLFSRKDATKKPAGTRPAPQSSKKPKKAVSGTFEHAARRSDIVRDGKERAMGASVCPECRAVYYDKHWHSPALVSGDVRTSGLPKVRCEQCRGILSRAGTVIIEGLAAGKERAETVNLIRNIGKRAMRRDPEDRIVKITGSGSKLTVWTSENQLAASIGRQLDSARKGGKLSITWSKDDKPVTVRWVAPKRK